MSATPIPRTLALVLYGDLDVSIINQMPIGRKAIKTYAVDESFRERINAFVRKEVGMGRQAYIVCPLVDDSEVLDAKSVTNYRSEAFEGLKTAIIHGKMKAAEKDEVMRGFASGEIAVLISTTVIEVGVDVPNATLMVIENSERYGLSTLHQLRGRVGRGEYQSYCILFVDGESEEARKRAAIMVGSTDGFEIAEEDLKLRGVGDFFGVRQHGLPELRIANIYEDLEVFNEAREAAEGFDFEGEGEGEVLGRVREMFIEGM